MKKTVLFSLLVFLLAFGFVGCGGDGDDEEEFISSINETVFNDLDTLGLVGTSATSNNESVATVVIESGKIKITSVAEGNGVITVSDGTNNATINVTVSKTGSITIGTIVKYNPFVGSWVYDVGNPNDCTITFFADLSFDNIGKTGDWKQKGTYTFTGNSAQVTIEYIDLGDGAGWTNDPNKAFNHGLTTLPETIDLSIENGKLIYGSLEIPKQQ